MGQALPKHHWHEADRFLIAAQLHVPQTTTTQQQQKKHAPRRHHNRHKTRGNPAALANDGALSSSSPPRTATIPDSQLSASPPPSSPEEDDPDQTMLHHTPSPSPSSSSSLLSSEASPALTSSDDDDDDDDARPPPAITDLPTQEAAALAAAHWARVLELARGFESAYARAVEAWVARCPSSAAVKKDAQDGTTEKSKENDDDDDDDAESSKKKKKKLRRKKKKRRTLSGKQRLLATTTRTRAVMSTWTAADLVDLATRGPLRCYRWHSGGDGRAGKERSRRQLCADAAKMGWSGRLLARHFRDQPPPPPPSSPPSASRRTGADRDRPPAYGYAHDSDTGLRSIAVRSEATLTVAAHTLALVKLLTTLFPSGPPWMAEPMNVTAALPPGFLAEAAEAAEAERYHRRVWVAMALGWAWCLEAYFAGHPEEGADAGGSDEEREGERGEDEDGISSEMEDGEFGEGDEDAEIDDEQLEQMSEVDIDDEDVLAALARAADEEGQRNESLMPSDGEEEEEGVAEANAEANAEKSEDREHVQCGEHPEDTAEENGK